MANVVDVAFVEVELVKTPVDGVAAPIGVFSMGPAEMVRLSATRGAARGPVPARIKAKVPP